MGPWLGLWEIILTILIEVENSPAVGSVIPWLGFWTVEAGKGNYLLTACVHCSLLAKYKCIVNGWPPVPATQPFPSCCPVFPSRVDCIPVGTLSQNKPFIPQNSLFSLSIVRVGWECTECGNLRTGRSRFSPSTCVRQVSHPLSYFTRHQGNFPLKERFVFISFKCDCLYINVHMITGAQES